jgi:hypothetical protein
MNERHIRISNFYVVHSLSVPLDTNQTHMEVLCYGIKLLLKNNVI